MIWVMQGPVAAQPQPQRNDGVSTVCGDFVVAVDLLLFEIPITNRADEGWAFVDRSRRIREATGIAQHVRAAANDTPANHDSHDLTFNLLLDAGQDDLLSTQPDSGLHVEWETGIRPTEKRGDGANPTFPKWAWPSTGDRVWVNGNWIHDCGHPANGLYSTEIHPIRAIASMRDQAAPLPGTGLTPVPVTVTDLYISGNGGYTPQQLNCGPNIILGENGDNCGEETPPADQSFKTTPINDTDFLFYVCLPPRPSASAAPINRTILGPRNTVDIDALVEEVPVDPSAPCHGDSRYDQGTMMRVTVPLNGTPTPPTAVYARRIYSGWLAPPDPVLPHRIVTLESTLLREDHDFDSVTGNAGELSFWWMNVDRAESAWLRLSDHATGNMDSYDDAFLLGDGIMEYANATWDFYLRHDQTFSFRSMGFEQDCYDNGFLTGDTYFGRHELLISMYVLCGARLGDHASGDAIGEADALFGAEDLGRRTIGDTDDNDIRLNIDEVETVLEDTSHLSIQTSCTPAGEVALVGQPLTCATEVHNGGTGLPRQVHVTNRFSGAPAATVNEGTWSAPPPLGRGTHPCAAAGSEAVCRPDSVPVALRIPVSITTIATPTAPGLLTGRAEVTTASTDPDLANNVAATTVEVFRPVIVDVSPRNATNEVNLNRGGSVAVAILSTPDFNAATVDPLSVCFGDAGVPAQRSCTEQHRNGHIEDVDRNDRPDLLLHFDVESTGIDAGDTTACLIARTHDGIGLYGCAAIVTR